jgi:hypothetical protein
MIASTGKSHVIAMVAIVVVIDKRFANAGRGLYGMKK